MHNKALVTFAREYADSSEEARIYTVEFLIGTLAALLTHCRV